MVVDPMLATSGPLPEDEERWSFEPKWDGFRAIVPPSSLEDRRCGGHWARDADPERADFLVSRDRRGE
jgi:hypothetical protein